MSDDPQVLEEQIAESERKLSELREAQRLDNEKTKEEIERKRQEFARREEQGEFISAKERSILSGAIKSLGYRNERYSDRIMRENERLQASRNALKRGTTYAQEERRIVSSRPEEKRRQAIAEKEGISTLEVARREQSEQSKRFLREAEFKTRQYTKLSSQETQGKQSGIYYSELTGRPVVVRRGGGYATDYDARQKAQNFYTRPYVVEARVTGERYSKGESTPLQNTPLSSRGSITAPVTPSLPQGETGTNISVIPPDAQATPLFIQKPVNALIVSEEPKRYTSQYYYYKAKVEGAKQDVFAPARSTLFKGLSLATGTFQYTLAPLVESNIKYTKALSDATTINPDGTITQDKQALQKAGYEYSQENILFLGAPLLLTAETIINPKGQFDKLKQSFTYNPYGTVGGALPLFIEGARVGGAKIKASSVGSELRGTVAGAEAVEAVRDVPSPYFRVQGVEQVDFTTVSQAQGGKGITFQRSSPTLSEVEYLTPDQIPIVDAYDVSVTGVQGVRVRPATSSRNPALSETVASSAETSFQGVGRATPEQVGLLSEKTFSTSVYDFESPTGTISESITKGSLRFSEGERAITPYEFETPTASGAPKFKLESSPYRIDYRPSLDFWEKVLVETPTEIIYGELSYATGATRGGSVPKIIRSVETSQKPVPVTPKGEGGVQAGTSGSVFIEQPDGTILQQEFKYETPSEAQKTTVITETKETGVSTGGKKGVPESTYAGTDEFSVQYPVATPEFYVGGSGKTVPPVQKVFFAGLNLRSPNLSFTPASASILGTSSGIRSATAQSIIPIVAIAQDQAQATRSATAQSIATDTIQDTAQLTEQATTPRNNFPRNNFPREIETILPRPRTSGSNKRTSPFATFGVQVRSGGKFKTIASGLGITEATRRGASIVGTTTSASFRLTPESSSRQPLFSDISSNLPFGFRPAKRDASIIVEKRGFRISTTGEKKGLRLAKRKKGLFGGLGNELF